MKSRAQTFLCISVGWILLVCYSVFLTSAVESIIESTGIVPSDENTKQIITFIYGLAVVSFLGGSQIPAVFLKKKSFVIQFGFSATFGLMLLLLNLNATSLRSINDSTMTFFSSHPVIAIEYLSIPYFFMIFIDIYLDRHLDAFSWRHFGQFLKGIFLHPRETFEEIMRRRSILFSLVTVVLVSAIWTIRTAVFFFSDFVPTRWRFLPFGVVELLEPVSRVVLIVPVAIVLWLIASGLIHIIIRRSGGNGGFTRIASISGFAFLPSLIAIAVDILEMWLQIENSLAPNVVFLLFGFVIPLTLWPLILVSFAIQKLEKIKLRRACLLATAFFLPLFILLTRVFL